MKKTLAVLALGTALSIFSPKIYSESLFSYSADNNIKQSEEVFSSLFNTFSMIREPNFEKKLDLGNGLEFNLKIKFDYDLQISPIQFNPISVCIKFLLQYNL